MPGAYPQNAQTETNFKCPNCPRTYRRLYCLNRHLRVECGKPPKYQCQVCNGWFKYKHNLTAHWKLHVEKPKYTCNFCDRKFYRPDKLAEHCKKTGHTVNVDGNMQ